MSNKNYEYKVIRKVSDHVTVVDKEQFVKVFLYKLRNLLKRSAFAFYHSVQFADPYVHITISNLKEDLTYKIDYSLPVKKNIFYVKNLLLEYFPVFKYVEMKERKATAEETEEMINNGMSVDQALTQTIKTKKELTYRIQRILIDKDEIFIYCKELDREFRYKMKSRLPLSLFLTKIKNKEYEDLYELGNIFFDNSIFLDTIIKNNETNKILKKEYN